MGERDGGRKERGRERDIDNKRERLRGTKRFVTENCLYYKLCDRWVKTLLVIVF